MKKSFSILLILRKDKKGTDKKYPLNIQVTINSKVMKLPTKHRVYLQEWDSINRCLVGKGLGELNNLLNSVLVDLRGFCYVKIQNGEPLTFETIRDYYNGVNLNCFYKVFDKVFEIKRKKLSEASIYKYDLLRKNLKEFKSRIDISQIDLFLIEKFEDFLIAKGSGIHGTCSNHTKLDAIINLAVKMKLLKENPYKMKDYKEISKKFNFLTPNELKKISTIEVNENAGLQLTKDRFLFSCYTAICHCDINLLKKGDIDLKKNFIVTKRKKNGNKVTVPLNKTIKKLILKYFVDKDDEDLLFPSVTNQNDNRRLKIFGSSLGLNFDLCFHDGRHTFGTIMVNYHNVPLPQVKELMGHSSIMTTAGYANVNLSMLTEAMGKMI